MQPPTASVSIATGTPEGLSRRPCAGRGGLRAAAIAIATRLAEACGPQGCAGRGGLRAAARRARPPCGRAGGPRVGGACAPASRTSHGRFRGRAPRPPGRKSRGSARPPAADGQCGTPRSRLIVQTLRREYRARAAPRFPQRVLGPGGACVRCGPLFSRGRLPRRCPRPCVVSAHCLDDLVCVQDERERKCVRRGVRESARESERARESRARERERDPVSDESNCPSPATGAARLAKAARASRREHRPGRPRAMRHARMTSQRTRQAKERTLAVKYRAAARASQCASGLDT